MTLWWVNGNLLQEGLCHRLHGPASCTQSPCPCSRPLLMHTSAGDTNIGLAQSLWGLCVLCIQGFVWALPASLAVMGFHSKCDFAPSTILLGASICPWMWVSVLMYLFLVGSNILLSMVIQQQVVICWTSKMNTCPSIPPYKLRKPQIWLFYVLLNMIFK